MAQVTRAAHASSVSTLLANNTGGNISAADIRSVITDLEDSVVWNDEQNLTSVNGNTGVVTLDADDIDDTSTSNKFVSAADISKLAGVEANATADQTGAQIKSAYEGESNTNAFTDAEQTKLSGIETSATADQTDVEIETAYNNQVAQVSGGEKTAGSETAIRRFAPQDIHDMIDDHAPGGGGGGISDVVDDTSPQLGGNLDGQGNDLNNMGVLFLTEQASAEADVAGKGQLWVETATPNILKFTDDAGTDADVLTSNSGTVLTDTATAGGDSVPFFDTSDSDNAKQRTWTNIISDLSLAELGANTFTGTQDFNGQQVEGMLNKVVSSVTGTLTTAAHSGNVLETSGNVTIPTTAGFNCVLIAGGAHTVTFNSNTSPAMAAGDLMTLIVEDSTTIHAVLTASADKVSFT